MLDMFYMRMVIFVYKCLRSESSLINGIGIIYGQMDSIIGRNILNCSFRYKISLDNILNLHFQPRDSAATVITATVITSLTLKIL